MERESADLSVRYPAAYRRLYAYFNERRPDADHPVESFRLVGEIGFVTREPVIRKILQNADWAREVTRGYFAWNDPSAVSVQPVPSPEVRRAPEPAPISSSAVVRPVREASPPAPRPVEPNDALAEQVRRVLKKESEHNRLGVSLTYLKRLCGNPREGELLRILEDAPWVRKQYGMFRYEETETENVPAVPAAEAFGQIVMEIGEIASAKEESLPDKGPRLSPDDPETDAAVSPIRKKASAPHADRSEREETVVQLSMEIPDEGKEELRVGTVMKIKKKKRAANGWAAVDFGADFGKADAGIPIGPATEKLIGKQVVCAVGFREGKRSVRILTADTDRGAVAVVPAEAVRNGDRVE